MSDGPQNVSESAPPVVVQPVAPFWQVPWEFAVHALVGTSIFAIIAAVAVLLEVAVRKLGAYGVVGRVVILGLKMGEYSLLGVDLVLFDVFLWRTARRTIKHL
jgi:hypothetical protein